MSYLVLIVCGLLCALLDVYGHELHPSTWWLLGVLSVCAARLAE